MFEREWTAETIIMTLSPHTHGICRTSFLPTLSICLRFLPVPPHFFPSPCADIQATPNRTGSDKRMICREGGSCRIYSFEMSRAGVYKVLVWSLLWAEPWGWRTEVPKVRDAEPTAPGDAFPQKLLGVRDAVKVRIIWTEKCKIMLHSDNIASYLWTSYAAAN